MKDIQEVTLIFDTTKVSVILVIKVVKQDIVHVELESFGTKLFLKEDQLLSNIKFIYKTIT